MSREYRFLPGWKLLLCCQREWGGRMTNEGEVPGLRGSGGQLGVDWPPIPLASGAEIAGLKNRSDLALAKFEEADKYAPNWGQPNGAGRYSMQGKRTKRGGNSPSPPDLICRPPTGHASRIQG
jgi:hypothetical protein